MLGFCRDPFVRELHRLGYTLMPLAEAGVQPLDCYGRQGRELFRLGALGAIFKAGEVPLPVIARDIEAGEIKTSKSSSVDGGLGAGIVADWMGGQPADISTGLQKLQRFTFQFGGLLKDRVDLASLDAFLNGAGLDQAAPAVRQMLEADQVYVVCAVLKAVSVAMSASTEQAVKAEVKVKAAAGIPLNGKAQVKYVSKGEAEQEFRAQHPLAFAIQATQVCFVDGRYKTVRVERRGLQLMSDNERTIRLQSETGWLTDDLGPYFPRIATAS